MQSIIELIQLRQELVSDLPQWVKNWVLFMRIVFFSSIFFLIWWKPARWVFVTMLITFSVTISSLVIVPDLDTKQVGTIIQLIIWTPLAYYLFRQLKVSSLPALGAGKLFGAGKFFVMVYGGWALLATGVLFLALAMNLYQFISWFF